MSKLFKICIFTLFIVTLFGSLKSAGAARVRFEYRNYNFISDEQDTLLLKQLMRDARPRLQKLEEFYRHIPTEVVTIQLTSSESAYRRIAAQGVPEWSQAVAFPSQSLIVMRVVSAEEVQQAAQTLTHELSHLFCADIIPPNRLPVWLNEGLAQYISGKRLGLNDQVLLANALVLKRVPQLKALEALHSFSPPKARLAYIQALSAVEYFVHKHGEGTLSALVHNLGKFRSEQRAWLQTVGYDFIDFELNWYESTYRAYRWLVWLNLDHFIWLTMGLLAVAAIVLVRRRSRKKLESWDNEEFYLEADEENRVNL